MWGVFLGVGKGFVWDQDLFVSVVGAWSGTVSLVLFMPYF